MMKANLLPLVAGLVLVGVTFPARAQDDAATLAKKVQKILDTHCYRCHGQDGANEGGLNYILDWKKLVERKKVVPRDPVQSKIYRRLLSEIDPMPPLNEKVRPSKEELALIRQWIEAGVPDYQTAPPPRKFITNEKILEAIKSDLTDQVNERDRPFIRYFTLTHLYNAGLSEDELQSYRQGLSKLVNSLSWDRQITLPRPIDPEKTILRIDLRDYSWSKDTWEIIVSTNPYGLTYNTPTGQTCYTMTNTALPYVRGDWFVHAASRPPLYHLVLALPLTEMELENKVAVEVAVNIRQERVARAGFNGSGVSRNNRLLERHKSGYGYYWKSYDFAGNAERKNLFEYPLGPGSGKDEFEHDGGEIIFSLPNGLQGYFLADAEGHRLDKGPVAIVSDPKRPDRAVENGLSCMSCHARGLISKDDQVGAHAIANKTAFDETRQKVILALYKPKDEFQGLIDRDAKLFQEVVNQSLGKPKEAALPVTEPVAALASLFEQELDKTMLAAEAGLTFDELEKLFDKPENKQLAKALGAVRVSGQTVHRDQLAANFASLSLAIGKGKPVESGGFVTAGDENRIKLLLARPIRVLTDPGTLDKYRGRIGKVLYFDVSGDANKGTIYGTGIYTDDSYLATAAVHAGILKSGQSGVIKVTILEGQKSYQATTRNGVSSYSYDSYYGSYRVETDDRRDKPAVKGADSAIPLIAQLSDSTKSASASQSLTMLGPLAIPALREALEHKDATVRDKAQQTLDSILVKPNTARVAMRHSDPEVRQDFLNALQRGGQAKELVPLLLEGLKDKDESARESCELALFLLDPRHKALEGTRITRASVQGKYSKLLRRISVPEDKGQGEFVDYGKYSPGSYGGYDNLPAGYWVYVYPHWYIWSESR